MEEVGAQVASPVVAQGFCSTHSMNVKRGLHFNSSSFVHQDRSDYWNPKSWDWDSARFTAKPLQCDKVQVGSVEQIQSFFLKNDAQSSALNARKPGCTGEDENLQLKLGGGSGNSGRPGVGDGMKLVDEPQPSMRPNKKVRSGSPAGANYPMCQVDNCKEDLSTAKDYHRRHKVCEVHSKASEALVGKQMQRFCQQCSRFHTLSEFDEGKRSCRRRLAGHNRRRRKTQSEDTTPQVSATGSGDSNVSSDINIINLLAVLARAQGNTEDRSSKVSLIPDKDQLIQILSKINSLPSATNNTKNGSIPSPVPSENHNIVSRNGPSQSTRDLLAVLPVAPGAPSSEAFDIQSQLGNEVGDSEKRESSTSYHSPMEEVDCHQEASPNLHLRLFSSSPEDGKARKLQLGRNYLSSSSSNPSEEISPASSPPLIHNLFPTSRERMKDHRLSNSEHTHVKASSSNGCSTALQLFGGSTRAPENGSTLSSHYQAGYTSSSGSDHSTSSLNSDSQDRTGRIIFKLFDKDPSKLPGTLRAQIFNWLSNSPSEMESYIRPGCIVLSLYLSMPSFAWDQLEENLLTYTKSLVVDIDADFWGSGRFLLCTDRQMVTHKDRRIRLCKSWRVGSTPKLISVSPVAVVAGQETSLILRGRSLNAPGTQIHCTHTDMCNIREVSALSWQDTVFDEIRLDRFKINRSDSSILGRCFIEVESSFSGSSFPIIIADSTICRELRLLEPEINCNAEVFDGNPADQNQNMGKHWSRKEVLHFLDELGWLFQRKHNSSLLEGPSYKLTRFKFLLTFSVEHDFCALVKTLLDILLELNLGTKGLARESLALLSEIQLLSRAVKRKCRSIVDLLLNYSIIDSTDNSEKFIFLPNMAGPGGVTPLHLAACTSSSDDIVDALTSDPQEKGLHSWKTVLDVNGLSPYAYAVMRNNHSYNALIAQKLSDRKNGHVSLSIENVVPQLETEVNEVAKTFSHFNRGQKSCSRCAAVAVHGYRKIFPGSLGLLQRPYIHSVLLIAAVCACVSVFLRGHPDIGYVAPFAWENLDYGAF